MGLASTQEQPKTWIENARDVFKDDIGAKMKNFLQLNSRRESEKNNNISQSVLFCLLYVISQDEKKWLKKFALCEISHRRRMWCQLWKKCNLAVFLTRFFSLRREKSRILSYVGNERVVEMCEIETHVLAWNLISEHDCRPHQTWTVTRIVMLRTNSNSLCFCKRDEIYLWWKCNGRHIIGCFIHAIHIGKRM